MQFSPTHLTVSVDTATLIIIIVPSIRYHAMSPVASCQEEKSLLFLGRIMMQPASSLYLSHALPSAICRTLLSASVEEDRLTV